MTGMRMSAAGHLGMWMAMMVPMMLPSLVPMLSSYRRSVRGADGIHPHGLTALVGVGYFLFWAVLGATVHAAGDGILAIETRPVVAGGLLLLAGGVQLTSWKARRLELCREGSECGRSSAPNALGAVGYGLRLGVRCCLCCASLMLAMVAIGMMNPVVTAAVTLAISAERFAPVPLRIARAVGVVIVLLGAQTIARA
jgi:predicted metal-binding membrane protein